MTARLILGSVLAGLTLLLGGCGSPAGKPAFEFTPLPYEVVLGPAKTPIAVATYQGRMIMANEVIAVVENEHLESVKRQLEDLGFKLNNVSILPKSGDAVLFIEVPLGSVPDAIKFIKAMEGALEVGPSGTLELLS